MTDLVEISERSGVMEIRLNRPEKKNALTAQMYRDMTAGLEKAARSPHIRVLLITGAGDSFCAGNDLNDFLAATREETSAIDFIRAIANFDKPVVAAVQGKAVGVGTTLLLHCDLVYSSPDASFQMPFVSLGLVPEAASSLLAAHAFGTGGAARMLLLSEVLGADEARSTGFLAEIVPAESLRDHAYSKAAAMAQLPPQALSVTRGLLRQDRRAINARIDQEFSLFMEALSSPETREIIASFFTRR